jgi:hypothetical protein
MRTRSGRGVAQETSAAAGVARVEAEHRAAEAGGGGPWLTAGKDGRLTAYARTRGGVLRWTETSPGGPHWTKPDFIPAKGVTHVTVVQGLDTYVHLLGRRTLRKADGVTTVDLVHAVQYQTGRPVTDWRSLGNPHADAERAAGVGVPVGAVSTSGRVHVFVRNAAGGLMLRREEPSGKWERWTDLKGSLLQDRFAVVAHESGRLEVLAGGRNLAMRWVQAKPGGTFERQPNIPVSIAVDSVSGLETAPDRATYYWIDPAAGGIVSHRPGGWLVPLGGAPAGEPVSVLRTSIDGYDCTVLAHRVADGEVMLAACATENEQAGVWWSQTGERCAGAPALARDGYGRVVLGMIGVDGELRVARQSAEGGFAMNASVPV